MKSKKNTYVPPDGFIRKSQMITTFGPGSMVDLLDQAVLVGGLDYWAYGKDKGQGLKVIPEPRLRDTIAEQLRKLGGERSLSVDKPFREPPQCDDKAPSDRAGVQVLEFPEWFVCQNPSCRALVRARDGLERKAGRWYHQCNASKAPLAVPVRFVGACAHGHLQDWPWIPFAHRSGRICTVPELELREGTTGDFSEITVHCRSCGLFEKLAQALIRELRPDCEGRSPWLGGDAQEDCSERLRLLVRTASNGYFAQVMSAISIPDRTRALTDAVANVWDVVKDANAATLPVFRTIDKVRLALEPYADADVLRAIAARKEGQVLVGGPIRSVEFQQFVTQPDAAPGDRPGEDDRDFFARRLPTEPKQLPEGLERVVLAHKLREVRVQIGFTRLEPISPDLEGEYGVEALRVRAAPLSTENVDWLPAVEIRGEGLFIQLREAEVAAWERRDAVQRRADELYEGYRAWSRRLESPPPFPGVRYYLLHSLSHLLITALSLECGYAASSIRERIYCRAEALGAMAAILLSTGTPGAEGTLGGLVEQAKRLRSHLRHAYDLGTLCSNDPVCGAHSPAGDQAERHLEGAACHGCLFIAECSCERFNNFLDRALVVPTMGQDPALAFFGVRP